MKAALLPLILLLAAAPAHAQSVDQSIKIATEAAYPPFNFFDSAGNFAGYDIDVGTEICKRAALQCTWVVNEWASIFTNMDAGNYDAIMADVTIDDERKKTMDFSVPYFPPDPSLYLHLASKPIDFDKLEGYRIGVQSSTVQAGWLNMHEQDNTILTYGTTDQALADLSAGNIDLMIAEGSYVRETEAGAKGMLAADGPPVPIGDGAAVAFRKSSAELRLKFDAAIEAMRADGTIDALIKKWFPEMGAGPYFPQ